MDGIGDVMGDQLHLNNRFSISLNRLADINLKYGIPRDGLDKVHILEFIRYLNIGE